MATKTEEAEGEFNCDYPGCTRSFDNEGSMIAHKRWHSRKRKSKDAKAPSKPVEDNPSPPNVPTFQDVIEIDPRGSPTRSNPRGSGDGKGVDLDNQEFEGDVDDVLDFIRGRALVHFNWSIENGTKNMNFTFAADPPEQDTTNQEQDV